MIITLGNRKGGCSKTTSVALLGTCFKANGASVIALDADNELSLTKWHSTGLLDFEVKSTTTDDLREKATELAKTHDYVLIDLPPNDEAILMKAASVSDEVIVTINASPQDLFRLKSTLESIKTIEDARNKDLVSVVLVRAKKGTNMLAETKEALAALDTPLCDTVIHDSVRYQSTTPSYLSEYQQLIKELDL